MAERTRDRCLYKEYSIGMKIEVLVAAMQQKDLSLHNHMNLKCDVLIANQCDEWRFDEEEFDYGRVRMISSRTRGVGKNRNYAISLAEGDILLFADDDIVYYEEDLKGVKKAFEELPDADVILFEIDMTKNGEVFDRRRCNLKKLSWWNSMKFGTCRMAVRKDSILKNSINFSTLFGGGTVYGSGEDSLFLLNCFHAGLRVYSYPYVLGACAKDSSSWFEGFNEKYFHDKGAWLSSAFPKSKHILKWYFITRYRKKTELSVKDILRQMNEGIRSYKTLKKFK